MLKLIKTASSVDYKTAMLYYAEHTCLFLLSVIMSDYTIHIIT